MDEEMEFQWELVGRNKENGEQVKYPCPPDVVGNIIKEMYKSMQGEMSKPDENIREKLKVLIDNKIITIELVQKLTKIPLEWLKQFLKGKPVDSITTKNMIVLAELVQNLNE